MLGRWTADSGASQHMTGSSDVMSDLNPPSPYLNCVTIGDNSEHKAFGRGKVVISNDLSIENVLLVESIGYNYCPLSNLHVPALHFILMTRT